MLPAPAMPPRDSCVPFRRLRRLRRATLPPGEPPRSATLPPGEPPRSAADAPARLPRAEADISGTAPAPPEHGPVPVDAFFIKNSSVV